MGSGEGVEKGIVLKHGWALLSFPKASQRELSICILFPAIAIMIVISITMSSHVYVRSCRHSRKQVIVLKQHGVGVMIWTLGPDCLRSNPSCGNLVFAGP